MDDNDDDGNDPRDGPCLSFYRSGKEDKRLEDDDGT